MNQWISEEFARRKSRNKAYSVRAFARDLGVPKSSMHDLLNGKRDVSKRLAQAIGQGLGLKDKDLASFTQCCSNEDEKFELTREQFHLISEWQHLAILNLVEIMEINQSFDEVADRLGIGNALVRSSLERLEKLGLVEIKNGHYQRTKSWVETNNNVPSVSQRFFHKQMLALADRSLDRDPVDERYFDSAVIAIDPDKLIEASSMIRKFRNKLSRFLSSGEKKAVYTISLQVFPTTEKE